MPRRLAPLLICLYIALTNAQNPTHHNTHAPVKAVAVAHTDVFIPLKQWKQQRLQDLESRVRKAEQRRAHPRRFLSAVCKPRARLLAFLARLDVCPPTPNPATSQSAPPHDPYWVSASHAYPDANRSVKFNRTAPVNAVQSSTDRDASASSLESPADSRDSENAIASTEPTVNIDNREKHQPSSEPDELTGRIEDYIPKVLPNVLPNVIPKVNEIVKSLKEASLAYTMSGEAPADSLSPRGKSASSAKRGNTTANSTSQENPANEHTSLSDADNRKPPVAGDADATAGLLEDDNVLSMIVKHNNDPGVKEKPFNYASVDAGARVLASSEGVVGAANIVQGSNDKYLLSPCAGSGVAGSRFVDLELSEEVFLESIETGNFEYYSSSPRKIAVLGASIYPPKKWNVLGIFDFANVKTLQKFQIEKRAVTRYLRVIFAGKQGTEYYCPVSTVRAFGKSLLADWKEVMEKPTETPKLSKESGGAAKNKLDKDGDTAKGGNGKNGKKSESGPSVTAENSSEDVINNPGSHTSIVPDNDTSDREERSDVRNEGVRVRADDIEHTENSDAPSTIVGQSSGEAENGNTDSVYDESDPSLKEADGDNWREEAEENVDGNRDNDDDTSDTNHASFSDGDHVSEDDQVVIDALRSDTLTPVDGDDNIFRKVTRMLRLLELNQTLTNQYIDTQLSKFAVALSDSLSNSKNATERVEVMQKQLEIMVVRLENQIEVLTRANFRRDVLMCILLVCVAFLLGAQGILWSTVSSLKLADDSTSRHLRRDSDADRIDRILQTDDQSAASLGRIEGISSEGPSPVGKKKKRKDRKKPFAGEHMNGASFSADKLSSRANGTDATTDGRSVSSVELSTNRRRRFSGTGGTFDILGRLMDQ